MQTYQQFTSSTAEADAQAYCNSQTTLMALPPGGVTTAWATPIELADGSYVVPEYQHTTGVPWDKSWQLPTTD